MRQERWRAILGARDDVDRLVASAVGDYPNLGPPRPAGRRPSTARSPGGPQLVQGAVAPVAGLEHEVLHRLHQDVHARIELLRAALAPEPGAEQAMLALVLYLDERVMGQLPEYLAPSWPLLQTRLTGRKTGGSDFFRLIDRLLEAEPPQPFVLEVYYFCLVGGFQGQYADDLASLEIYRQRLRARIAAPEPQRQAPTVEPAASPAPIRSRALYYAAAAAAVLMLAFGLTVWSNQ
jgi:type IV/VI secretion system ImpK/VasF family protein